MIPIQDLINKIRWDEKENPEDYSLTYRDFQEEKEIRYKDIKKIEDHFMIIIKQGEETNIPLHRIRKVKKQGRIIWQRKITKD